MPNQINAYDTARNLKAAGFKGCWVFALGTTDTANVAVGSRTTRAARIDRMMSVGRRRSGAVGGRQVPGGERGVVERQHAALERRR